MSSIKTNLIRAVFLGIVAFNLVGCDEFLEDEYYPYDGGRQYSGNTYNHYYVNDRGYRERRDDRRHHDRGDRRHHDQGGWHPGYGSQGGNQYGGTIGDN